MRPNILIYQKFGQIYSMLNFRRFACKTYAAQDHIWPWEAVEYKQNMEEFSQNFGT